MDPEATGSVAGALFLGALQGLTEFLPVSSSGHLVLFQQFIDVGSDTVFFDLVLHLGTLVPVLWFYRADLRNMVRDLRPGDRPLLERPGARLIALVVVASIPTAVIGFAFEDVFESLFSRPAMLTVTFAITGTVLFATRHTGDGAITTRTMPWVMALGLGLAQGLAITPGISRSGTTIAVALLCGVDKEEAARFSFLMSVPAITGAMLLKSREIDHAAIDVAPLLVGGGAALVVGYGALVLLVGLVKRGRLANFAGYCWMMAGVAGVIALTGIAG